MSVTLVDSNVILDVITEDSNWYDWSAAALEKHAEASVLVINPIIYAEVSISFDRIEDLDAALPLEYLRRAPLPWEKAERLAKVLGIPFDELQAASAERCLHTDSRGRPLDAQLAFGKKPAFPVLQLHDFCGRSG